MYLSNLVIEVTRKCNMKCQHCLRGGVQNIDINEKHLISLFSQLSEIGGLTITGGEPSQNLKGIRQILHWITYFNIPICNFYIATNGINVKIEFAELVLRLYNMCYEKEYCSLEISSDMYHQDQQEYKESILDGLAFTRKRNVKNINLIKQGRSKRGDKLDVEVIEKKEDFNHACVYLNAKGEIINGCDWSYINQKKNKLCDVTKLKEYYNNLKETNE